MMKMKMKIKKRVVSTLLALTMVAPYLPTGLITNAYAAVEKGNAAFSINLATGKYTATFDVGGTSDTAAGNYSFVLAPNVAKQYKEYVPSLQESAFKGVAQSAGLEKVFTGTQVGQQTGAFHVESGSGGKKFNAQGQLVFDGFLKSTVLKDLKSTIANVDGYVDAKGNSISKDTTTSIDLIAVLWHNNEYVGWGTATWNPTTAATVEIESTDYFYAAPSGVSIFAGSYTANDTTHTGMVTNNGNKDADIDTTSIKCSLTTTTKMPNGTITTAAAGGAVTAIICKNTGDTESVDSLAANESYYIKITTTAPIASPATGTVTFDYYDENGDKQTETVPVSMYPPGPRVVVGNNGAVTFTEGKAATTASYTYPDLSVTKVNTLGPLADTTLAKDSNSYVEVTKPAASIKASTTANEDLSSDCLADSKFEFKLLSAGEALKANEDGTAKTYQVNIPFVYRKKVMATATAFGNATISVPITITVNPATGPATYTATFHKNDGSTDDTFVTQSDLADGASLTWPTSSPARSGYTFLGWDTNKDADSASWTSGSTAPTISGANVDYYAIWQATSVTLKDMEAAGAVGSALSTSVTPVYGTDVSTGGMISDTYTYTILDPTDSMYKDSVSFTFNGVTITATGGSNGVTLSSGSTALANGDDSYLNITVKATSNTNGADDTATLKLQVPPPPKITGADSTGKVQAGEKITLTSVKVHKHDGTNATVSVDEIKAGGQIPTGAWYLGGADHTGSMYTIDAGPSKEGTIPEWAAEGQHVWVKLAGDDVNVDAEEAWIDLGAVGKETKGISVAIKAYDASGKLVSSTPDGLSASPTTAVKLGVSENTSINTTNVSNDYEFKGWSTDGTIANIKKSSPYTDSTGGWTLTFSAAKATGVNNATFAMGATLPTADVTVYAVYQAKAKANLTVGVLTKDGATYAATTPSGITVSGSKTGMMGKAQTTIATSSSGNDDYKFVGWTTTGSSAWSSGAPTSISFDGNGSYANSNGWGLTSGSVNAGVHGSGSATFTMADTPANVYIYALYEKLPTYTLTVNFDVGIDYVDVLVNGKTTKVNASGGTVSGIKATDMVTVTSYAKDDYNYKAITFTGIADTDYKIISNSSKSTAVFNVLTDGTTVTAESEAKPADPPQLVLTPVTVGAGTLNGSTMTSSAPATAKAENKGGSTATIKSVAISDTTNFELSGLAANDTIVKDATVNSITIAPKDGAAWEAKTYPITITVTYADADSKEYTASTLVSYIVSETKTFSGSVTVKKDGTAVNGATVTVNSNTVTTDRDGKATFTGLTIGNEYDISVDLDGTGTNYKAVTITPQKVKSADPDPVVNFYTVETKLDSSTAAAVFDGSKTVKLSLNASGYADNAPDKEITISSTSAIANTTSMVVQSGTRVTIEASTTNTAYTFDKWTKGDTSNQVSTNARYTVDVTSTDTAKFTAHLKKSTSTAVLKYDGNWANAPDRDTSQSPSIGVPAAEVKTVGEKVTVSTQKPTLPGYHFVGWGETATAKTATYTGSEEITLTGNKTLYAIWEDATITITTPSLKNGKYGDSYDQTITATSNDGSTAFTFEASGLPGGLAIRSNGQIYGKPYVVNESGVAVTITAKLATDYHATNKARSGQKVFNGESSNPAKLIVNKATPTVTSVVIDNAVPGKGLTTADYIVTVAGPRFTGAGTNATDPSDDQWETYSDVITYTSANPGTATHTKQAGLGTLTAFANKTTDASSNFEASTNTLVNVTFAPGAVGIKNGSATGDANEDFDAHSENKQNTVWAGNNGDGTASPSGQTYILKVKNPDGTDAYNSTQSWLYADSNGKPAHQGYSVNVSGINGLVTNAGNGAADVVAAKQFTIKNEGNTATGALTYAWSPSSNCPFKLVGAENGSALTAGGTRNITIAVDNTVARNVSTYQGSLTISDAAHGTSAVIYLTFAVTDPLTFDAIITVSANDGSTTTVTLPDGVTLEAGGKQAEVIPAGQTDVGKYKISGLTVGQGYGLTAKGTASGSDYTIPGVTLSSTNKTGTVNLFKIALEKNPADLANVTQSGAGWYVSGQYAQIQTSETGKKGETNYDFTNWTYLTSQTVGGATANVPVTGATTYTANYTERDATVAKISYYQNAPGSSNGGSLLTEQPTTIGATNVAITTLKPTLGGYVFDYWTTEAGGGGTKYSNPALIDPAAAAAIAKIEAADVKLYAHWTVAAINNWSNVTNETAKYGEAYSYVITPPSTTDGAGVTLSLNVNDLPAGLTFDADTGRIWGKPYEMARSSNNGVFDVTVTATHNYWDGTEDHKLSNAALTKTMTFTLTMEKYTPVLANLAATDVVANAQYSTAKYTGTVTAPLLTAKDSDAHNPNGDTWVLKSWNVASANATQPADTQGTLAAKAGTTTFSSTGPWTVAMQHTPDGTKKDAQQNLYSAIYNTAEADVTASLTNTYTMTVTENNRTPANTGASITMQGAAGSFNGFTATEGYGLTENLTTDASKDGGNDSNGNVNLQLFTITGTGNVAPGKLTVSWGSTGTTESKYFTLGTFVSGTTAINAVDGTQKFTIVPKIELLKGEYPDTLTITNANGGSVTVKVSFKVAEPMGYPVTITTKHFDVNDNTGSVKDLTAGSVELVPTDNTEMTAPTMTGSNGTYTGTAVYGHTYRVKVNGYKVPNLLITGQAATQEVELYQVKVKDEFTPTATADTASTVKSSANNTAAASVYVVKGENATVTMGSKNGYSFKELKDGTTVVATSPAATYTVAITEAKEFTACFTNVLTLTYKPNGSDVKKPGDSDPVAATDVVENHNSGDVAIAVDAAAATDASPAGFGWTREGYTFTGWNTAANGSGTAYAVGAGVTIGSSNVVLYAQWTPGSGSVLTLTGATYTVAHKDGLDQDISGQASGGIGNKTFTRDDTVLPGGVEFAPATPSGKTTSFYVDSATYDKDGTNEATTMITVKDSASPQQSAEANFTIKVVTAKTQVATGFTAPADNTVKAGDPFKFDKLGKDNLEVNALKTDNTNVNTGVEFVETPDADGDAEDSTSNNLGGTWTVKTPDGTPVTEFLPGENTYVLTFTPDDKGFEPCSQELVITVPKKEINLVTVGIVYPENDETPIGKDDARLKQVTATTTSPTIDTSKLGDYVTIEEIAWTGGLKADGKFDTTQAITVIARLTPRDGWVFAAEKDFTGKFIETDDDTFSNAKSAEILKWAEDEVFIMLKFDKENTPITKVNVNPGNLVVGAHTTSWGVNTEDAPKYYVDTTKAYTVTEGTTVSTKWFKNSDSSEVTSAAPFEETKETSGTKAPLYDAVVVIHAQDGYEFDPATFAWKATGTQDDLTTTKATQNNTTAPEGGKTAKMECTLLENNKVLVIRYSSFPAVTKEIASIVVKGDPGAYYAKTGESTKHHDNTAKGNASGEGFQFDAAGIKVYPIYVDGSEGTVELTTGYEIGKWDGTTFTPLADNYGFKEYGNDTDVEKWDGQTLYVKYTVGDTTTYTAVPGTLSVKPLKADEISVTAGGPVMNVNVGDKFSEENNTAVTVKFNSGTDLANTVTDLTVGTAPTTLTTAAGASDARPNYYYVLDIDGDGVIEETDTKLVTGNNGTEITADMHGKDIYICYTDVNGTLVTKKTGTLGATSSFTVTVTDENGQDPEYGDKLTATPQIPDPENPDKYKDDPNPDNYDYQWEKWTWGKDVSEEDKKNPDNIGADGKGSWEPIPGGTSPDYRPGKDDVGETIRVKVTDKTTGTEVDGEHITGTDPITIEKRSINFTVDVKDKKYDGNSNNTHTYTDADFHATQVKQTKSGSTWTNLDANAVFGGVMLGDEVKIKPVVTSGTDWNEISDASTGASGRPVYKDNSGNASKNVGSTITWPEIVTDAGVTAGHTGGYTFTAGGDYYRLAAQAEQTERGQITDGTVTHVDVSFKEVPTYDHKIPGSPMGVTDARETRAGEASGTDDLQTYTATWYTGANHANFDPTDPKNSSGATLTAITVTDSTKFTTGAYTVVVKVKPQPGYSYNLDNVAKDITKFYFHFGEDQKVEVTKAEKGTQGLMMKDNVYYMWYTFSSVDLPKIAYVNASVAQPVAEKTASTGTATVVQAIDASNADVTTAGMNPTTPTVTWYEQDAAGTGWSNIAMDPGAKFSAGKKYKAEFDLTVQTGYEYLVSDTGVKFTISGKGPILKADNVTDATEGAVITKVTTSTTSETTAKTTYHVVVEYGALTGGRVALTDVYVNASVPKAGEEKSGPAVDAGKPYGLVKNSGTVDASKSKWQYWDGDSWEDASNGTGLTSDGKFKPGTDYRVIATVTLTDTEHYRVTTGTKFYLAGVECTAAEANSYHTNATQDGYTAGAEGANATYKPLVPSDNAENDIYADSVTYQLIREFSIPSDDISLITVTYDEPRKGDAPDTTATYEKTSQVEIKDGTNGTNWYTLAAAPADKTEFVTSSSHTANFGAGTYYMVESIIYPKGDYKFVASGANATKVTINGITVTVNGDMATRTVGTGVNQVTTGWAMAETDTVSDQQVIKAYYVAKTPDEDKTITKVWADVKAPSAGGTPAATVTSSTVRAINDSGNDVTEDGLTDKGVAAVTWEYKEGDAWKTFTVTPGTTTFNLGTEYRAKFTMTTNTGDGYAYKDDASDNSKRASFVINGLTTIVGDNHASPLTESGITVSTERKSNSSYEVIITFPATTDLTPIKEVTVDYTEPANGGSPAASNVYTPTAQVTLGDQPGENADTNQLVTNRSTGSTWFDDSTLPGTGDGLAGSATFDDGDYVVLANFAAVTGNKFTNDTKFVVNGTTYTAGGVDSHVTIAADGLSATVWHKFPGADKEIVEVTTAVTAPVAGAAPQPTANTTKAANESGSNLLPNALGSKGLVNISWTKANGDAFTGNFEYSTAYKATFTLTTASGYNYLNKMNGAVAEDFVDFIVNDNDAIDVADVATDDANNVKGTKKTLSVTDDDKTTTILVEKVSNTQYRVTITFPATEDNVQNVTAVHVDTTVPPVYKETIPTVTVRSEQPYVDAGSPATAKWEEYDEEHSTWKAVTTPTFQNGVKYRVTAQVKLKDDPDTKRDWDIAKDTNATKFYIGTQEIAQDATTNVTVGDVTATATFKAEKPTAADPNVMETSTPDGTTKKYDDATIYTVTLTFDALTENKTIVDFAANVTTPISGANISDAEVSEVLARNEDGDDMLAHVEVKQTTDPTPVDDIKWEESTDGTTWSNVTGTTFVKDTIYRATFTVSAESNYKFKADGSDYIDFLINSVVKDDGAWINGAETDVEANGIKVTTAQNGGTNSYKITVTFPATKDKADVLTVWGIAQPEVGHSTALTGDNATPLTVPGTEPYQLATGDTADETKWMHWNTTSNDWEDATGDFIGGETYKAVIKVEMKTDVTSQKYQFVNDGTSKTAGHVNDTEEWNNVTNNTMEGTNVIYTAGTGSETNPQYVTIERVFKLDATPTDVHVSSDAPEAGKALPTSITVPSAYNDKYEFVTADTEWTGTLDDNDKVKDGETYTLTVKVKATEGYQLPDETDAKAHYHWDNTNQTATTYTKNGDGTATVTFTYTVGGGTVVVTPKPDLLEVLVTAPVAGKAPDTTGKKGNDDTTVVGSVTWTKADGSSFSGNFDYSTSYKATVTVTPVDPDNFDLTDPKYKLNGQTPKLEKTEGNNYTLSYTFPATAKKEVVEKPSGNTGSTGGGTVTVEIPVVTYWLGETGITDDLTAEKVTKNKMPAKVPTVTGVEGYKFLGWSETDPAKTTGKPVLVNPKTFKITKDKTFYAVYEVDGHTAIDHSHYVIGYPDGTFRPNNNIDRASVATIIARACLDGFVEGTDYGNPGQYTDVEGHWAASAIAFCTKNGVFTGYDDGTFQPNKSITRQEFTLVVARLAGMKSNQGLPFKDSAEVSPWAADGVYTAFVSGWVNGYEDNTFRPHNNITRAEAVKIFNGFLGRGVDAEGLSGMKEYVHSGVASNNTGNGHDEYMTWPDVTKSNWAYYEIIEAANDHTFYWVDENNPVPPEHWQSVWIDEVWRYHDDPNG